MAKNRYNKLELTWVGKEEVPRLEPRILLEQPEKSYAAPLKGEGPTFFDNMLIHGDNLLALKALEAEYTGKVKCACIDPPYNTGSAFAQYDDGVEHSLWLSLMRDRLALIGRLLGDDGSIWIFVDDNEVHYLKVLCDETFGRASFIANMIWEKRTSRENRRTFSFNHDHLLVYAKNKPRFEASRNALPLTDEVLQRYKNPDGDPRGPWQSVSATAQGGHATASQFYELRAPNGTRHRPPEGRCWLYTEDRMADEVRQRNIWFGEAGNNVPRIKKFLRDNGDAGLTPETIWRAEEVGTNDHAKKHLIDLFDGQVVFDTPKPETLIARVLHIATNSGDLVLDSFLGSGTTAAVAQKMRRRWIGVELGDHCDTACLPRLRKVVDGADVGGATSSTSWRGGGGFRYFELAPSLLEQDRWGNWVISKTYNPAMLAAAMCKHEGFTYAPSPSTWWQHGRSTERDFIYITTQTLTKDQLRALSVEVGEHRSLLICCGSFQTKADEYPNLTLKKIPNAVLDKCEWGRDDYSLNTAAMQAEQAAVIEPAPPEPPSATVTKTSPAPAKKATGKKGKVRSAQELPLFGSIK